MAYILEELDRINEGLSRQQGGDDNSYDLEDLNINYLQQKISLALKKEKTMYFNVQEYEKSICIVLLYCNIFKTTSLIFKIVITKPDNQIRIIAKMLNFNLNYTLAATKEIKKLICKYLMDHQANQNASQCKLSLSMKTGQFKIQWPTFNVEKKIGLTTLSTILCSLLLKIENFQLLKERMLFISTLSNENPKYYLKEMRERNKERRQRIKQIYRYLSNGSIILNLAAESSTEELEIIGKAEMQEKSILNMRNNFVQPDRSFSHLQFYCAFDLNKYLLKKGKDYNNIPRMNAIQRQTINQKIILPTNKNTQKPNNSENYFVLNYIQLTKSISENVVRKIKIGGFTTIYHSEIEFWYVLSIGPTQNQQILRYQNYEKHLPPHRKNIAIKRETVKTKPPFRNRVAHEISILQQIKNGVSKFLPKYYLLAQKDNAYENCLLMDYIHKPNLSQYIKQNQQSFSISSKVYTVFMISQALRYLKQYKIVHLDLKPTNIMTSRMLQIKLIDFGEAYHPSLKNYEPGYSVPYSPPEIYNNSAQFTHKNDVFSLGVIINQIFFSKYPYYIHGQKLRKEVFLSGDFRNYWFCSPQQKYVHGQKQIMQLVYQLMIKCLKYDSKERLELQWVSLVFRQLYNLTL